MGQGLSRFGARARRFGIAFGEGFLLASRFMPSSEQDPLISVRREVSPEVLIVSPVELNIRSMAKFAQLAGDALLALGFEGGPVALLLPDLALRAMVLDRKEAQTILRGSREGLAEKLPFPVDEAAIDVWHSPPPDDRALVAVVRRAVVAQYEHAIAAVEGHAVWIDGTSLVSIPSWVEKLRREARQALCGLLQLYPRHYMVALFASGQLRDLRLRLRDTKSDERIVEELIRLPRWFRADQFETVAVSGVGASRVSELLSSSNLTQGLELWGPDQEAAQLAGHTRTLLQRF